MAEVMVEDSTDVFEINDFTNASPWERSVIIVSFVIYNTNDRH